MNALIMKGATIGDNCVIGSGSIVTGTIPPNSVAVGNPARVICSIEDFREKRCRAQKAEAKQLVQEYYRVYGKRPSEDVLSEFLLAICFERKNTKRKLCRKNEVRK